jgi:hypothetical protein
MATAFLTMQTLSSAEAAWRRTHHARWGMWLWRHVAVGAKRARNGDGAPFSPKPLTFSSTSRGWGRNGEAPNSWKGLRLRRRPPFWAANSRLRRESYHNSMIRRLKPQWWALLIINTRQSTILTTVSLRSTILW